MVRGQIPRAGPVLRLRVQRPHRDDRQDREGARTAGRRGGRGGEAPPRAQRQIKTRMFYPYISDSSFMALCDTRESFDAVAENMPPGR